MPATASFDSTYNGNYLQIFQCWGDPQTSDPTGAGSGPLPTQCEFGGESDTPTSSYPIQNVGFEYSRVLSEPAWDGYDQLKDTPGIYLDKSTGFLVQPFQPVNGTVVDQQANYNYLANPFKPQAVLAQSVLQLRHHQRGRLRPYLRQRDRHPAVPGGHRTRGPGPGLRPEHPDRWGAAPPLPQCWLVVVPRSTPTAENPANVNDVSSVVTSALTPEAWANRIAIPLQFNPVGSSCSINANAQADHRRRDGGPGGGRRGSRRCAICPGRPRSATSRTTTTRPARTSAEPSYGSVGMSVFSDPIPKGVTTKNPVVYAPLTLSGVVVAFNIERVPIVEPSGNLQPQEDCPQW